MKDFSKSLELEHFWRDVPAVRISNLSKQSFIPKLYRYSIDDLNEALNNRLLIDRFDSSFHNKQTIISDAKSFPYLMDLRDRAQSTYRCPDPSGWIYIFSNISEVVLGRSEEWFMFIRTKVNYECRLKIGRTIKHPFHRLRQQASSTAQTRPMLLLGLFWSPCAAIDEHNIQSKLDSYRVTDVPGIELFEIEPMVALEAIRTVLIEDRQPRNQSPSASNFEQASFIFNQAD